MRAKEDRVNNNETSSIGTPQLLCGYKPEKEKKIVCDMCGYANPEDTAQCKMCSNYLTKK